MAETFLKEEEQKVATNFLHKLLILDNRLKKQKDFDIVFSKGQRIHTKTLTLLYIQNKEFKFGISLSKKHGKAHLRNRIKRVIRAAVREIIKNGTNAYHIVVLPKINKEYDYHEIYRDLEYSLKKGRILSD